MNDRGSKKWVSLMIPEHTEKLRDLYNKENQIEKPILDEQKVEELNEQLVLALENASIVDLTIYSNYSLQTLRGCIKKLDSYRKNIKFIDIIEETHLLSIDNIVDISIL